MTEFDPIKHIENSELILDGGEWPNFHDSEIHELRLWRGDVRPEDDVWIGPFLEMSFELCALKDPYVGMLLTRSGAGRRHAAPWLSGRC